MKLVPIEEAKVASTSHTEVPGDAGGAAGPAGLAPITIDATKRQLLGLTTVEVKRAPFSTSIRTVGRVAYDERRVHHVHTRYEAFVEEVTADFTGKYVRKGEVLAKVYSPDLYATQKEYLLALTASKSLASSSFGSVSKGGEDLLQAARQRLLLWDITQADIDALEKRGEPTRALNIYAPISGFVTGRTAYHGMKVMAADTLFDIVDLSSVWVLADVYEYELPRLKEGQGATMTLSYWPGRSWTGRVTYVYPSVDAATRTIQVRLEFANPGETLKPEMFAQVLIEGSPRQALVVPDDVVLDSGERKVVFLSPGEGQLVPREISVGDQSDGFAEVTAGLSEGDVVARGANFLVDSESRLKSALSAMGPAPTPKAGDSPAPAPSSGSSGSSGSSAPPPAGHVH
jgi:Cu(I)/Ag(I) efflux system membrane fusion protein